MTTIKLTEEQQRILEAERGRPIEVFGARSQLVGVLLSRCLYERVRDVVETAAKEAVVGSASAGEAPPNLNWVEGEPMRLRLRDLPVPPTVAERHKVRVKELGLGRSRYARDVLDELMLQYYFGGRYVGYLATEDGFIVVAAGTLSSDEFGRQLDAVPSTERRRVLLEVPCAWDNQISELTTPFSHED